MSKNISLSALDLSIVAAGGNHKTAIERTVDIAQYIEDIGYQRIWLAEHHNMEYIASSATSILIGHVAQATKNIRVGSGGIMLPNHSPLAIAEQFGTLGTLYPNRIDLGLGRAPGTDGKTALALRGENYRNFYDFEANILQLQSYFENNSTITPVRAFPGEGVDIPIYILGSSTDSAHLSAKLGLPYAFAGHFAPQQLKQAATIYRQEFRPSKYLQEPHFMVCVNAVLSDSDAHSAFLSTSLFQTFIGVITNQRKPLQPPVQSMEGLWNDEIKYMVESMLACTFIGTKESIVPSLKNFIEVLQVDELIINSTLFSNEDRKKSYLLMKESVESL